MTESNNAMTKKPLLMRGSKKSRLTILISGVIFVIALILGIVMAAMLPKSYKFSAPSGNFINAIALAEGEWLYATTSGAIGIQNSENETTASFNIVDTFKKDFDITEGFVRRIERVSGTDYMYGIVALIGNDSGNYLFKASADKGDDGEYSFDIVAYSEFKGNIDNSFFLESDGVLYVLSTGQEIARIRCYNADDLSPKLNSKGKQLATVVYDTNLADGGKIKLGAIQMSYGVNIFEADENYIYIMYDTGFIRIHKDFEDVVYTSGQRQYFVDELDTSKYIFFTIQDVNSAGGTFVKGKDTFYIIDKKPAGYAKSFTTEDINSISVGDSMTAKDVEGVYLEALPKKSRALVYNEETNTGYVMYETTNTITRINFDSETVDFTFALAFNIDTIVYGENPSDVYYIYKNVNETGQNEENLLLYIDIELKRNEPLLTLVMIIAFTLAAIAFTVLAVMVVIVLRNKERDALLVVKKMIRHKWIYVALIPSVTLLCMFCYYEAVASIALSFFDYTIDNPTMLWNNFSNYKEVFSSVYSGEAFGNMLLFLVFDLIVAIVPPLLFAFFLTILRWEKLSNIVRTLLFCSGIIPSIAGMLVWKTGIYGADGVLNTIIEAFGGDPIAFLGTTDTAKWSILLMGFPFVGAYLIFYGGMMNIPSSLYEAAELEGVKIWQRFFKLDLPLILPQLKYVFVTSFIHSMQNYSRTWFLTGGAYGTKTPVQLMYQNMLNGNYGQASAYATIIFLLLFVMTFINFKTQTKDIAE